MTIQERTSTAHLRSEVKPLTIVSAHAVGYIQGATEQRKIDNDKACEWLNEVLCEFVITTINGIYEELTKEEFIEAFRKTMEDEQ